MARGTNIDVYFSVDVEADGPIPGPFSMESIGMAVCGLFDGAAFTPVPVDRHTFHAELAPISDRYDPEALAVSGLSREHLVENGREPAEAMTGPSSTTTSSSSTTRRTRSPGRGARRSGSPRRST